MPDYINKFTGELQKRDFGSFVWCPVSDFECHPLEKSLTAPDQVESLKSIIDRCMRGDVLGLPAQKVSIEEDLSDAELSMVDGTADLADIPSLVSAAQAADGANSEVEPRSGVVPQVSSSKQETAESETKSNDSSESKG